MMTLLEQFRDVVSRGAYPAEGAFRVQGVVGSPGYFVGADSSGRPCLLVETSDSGARPPIRLEAIDAQFSLPCSVSKDGAAPDTSVLTVISCRAADQKTQDYFLHVAAALIAAVGSPPGFAALAEGVQTLVDLFHHLTLPATKSLVGVIGELCLIAWSADPISCASAWRSDDDNRFDFATSDLRLEVKATSGRRRLHQFSFDQCSPPDGAAGLVVSLFVELTGGGTSLQDLLDRIEHRLSGRPDLAMKVNQNLAATLRRTLAGSLGVRFDERLARGSMLIVDARSVPAIRGDLPPLVSHVRFQSDLTSSIAFTAEWNGGLMQADIKLTPDRPHPHFHHYVSSHFSHGVVTFHTGYLFRTPPGWSMMAMGAPNHIKDGIQPLAGVVETDWLPFPFTMNWLFTRPGRVRFEKGEPFCFITLLQDHTLHEIQPVIRQLDRDPELRHQYDVWEKHRSEFNQKIFRGDPEATKEAWQRYYFKGEFPEEVAPAPEGHVNKRRLKTPRRG